MAKLFDDGVPTLIIHGTVATAPLINAVLADTGNLHRGIWRVKVHLAVEEANQFALEHRNQADAATLQTMRWDNTSKFSDQFEGYFNHSVADNESIRVINLVAGGVGIDYQVSLFLFLLDARNA